MGFGVSGSTAILFLGVLICTGTLYTAAAGSAERLTDAESENHERLLDRRNTEMDIATATFNDTTDILVIRANNTGSTTLSIEDTTVLVDNEYRNVSAANSNVDGNADTDLWAPGETLELELAATSPSRVKLVTETGISDSTVVN